MDQKTLLELFRANPRRAFTLKDILGAMGAHESKDKLLKRSLRDLVTEGAVERDEGRRFRLSRAGQALEGLIVVDERGRPSVELGAPGKRQKQAERVPLFGQDIHALKPGTRVRVELVAGRRSALAKVTAVLAAPATHRLGTFRRLARVEFVDPAGARPTDASVLLDELHPDLEDGTLVEFTADVPGSSAVAPRGRILAVVGKPGDRATEIRRLELEHSLLRGFPEAVEREAHAFGTEIPKSELAHREDLRALELVTIDGINARDFDDAVYAERRPDGTFRLLVAIADVAHYVQRGTKLDDEALARATSTYFPDRVYPMLPEALSNELCSLKPAVDRLCVVAELDLDADGQRVNTRLYRAVMRSRARLTYEAVAAALDGNPSEELKPLLPRILVLYQVAQLLLRRRLLRGAIELDLPEAELTFGPDGLPIDSFRRGRNDAHRLIEDLMLAANEAVAAWFEARELPTIYRVHEDPDPDRLAAFVELCEQLGLTTRLKKHKLRPKHVAELLEKLDQHPAGKPLHALLLRSLAQARYDSENVGHFGLAAEQYLHFTSPIRRYPDLMVHRLLMAEVQGAPGRVDAEEVQRIAEHCSNRERAASLAERASKDLDRAYVAARVMGQTLEGVVTGIQSFGVFVATQTPYVEGLIPIGLLGDDYFEPDAHGASLVGRRTGRRIPLGLPVKVEVVRVDIEKRQVELAPSESIFEGDRPEHPVELFGSRAEPRRAPADRGVRGRDERPGRAGDERPRRAGGERPARATGERPGRPGGERPGGERPGGARQARGRDERPARAREDRPVEGRDRKGGAAPGRERPAGERSPSPSEPHARGARSDRAGTPSPWRGEAKAGRSTRPKAAELPPGPEPRAPSPEVRGEGATEAVDRRRFTLEALKARLRERGRLPAEPSGEGRSRGGKKGGTSRRKSRS